MCPMTTKKRGRMWRRFYSSCLPNGYACHRRQHEVCTPLPPGDNFLHRRFNWIQDVHFFLLPFLLLILYVSLITTDIVDGNLKSAMRLILALAAHFKPSASASHRAGASMGRGTAGSSPNHRPHSTMAMAQNAVAALAVARQDASRSGRSLLHLRQEWNR